jgi:tetratricopeptide (TPR) repeat protein
MIELLLQAERAMSVGLVDRAEVLYAQVADADPQNSIAVVGLARVALERGDEAEALALAQRALTIDPENAAAARMVERLDEVIAYRGESPGTDMTAPDEPTTAPVVDIEAPPAPPAHTPTPAPAGPASTPPPRRPSLLARLFGRFRRG